MFQSAATTPPMNRKRNVGGWQGTSLFPRGDNKLLHPSSSKAQRTRDHTNERVLWGALENMGNSCYINAMMQVWIHVFHAMPAKDRAAFAALVGSAPDSNASGDDEDDGSSPEPENGDGNGSGADNTSSPSSSSRVRGAGRVFTELIRFCCAIPPVLSEWNLKMIKAHADAAENGASGGSSGVSSSSSLTQPPKYPQLLLHPARFVTLVRDQYGLSQQDVHEFSRYIFDAMDDCQPDVGVTGSTAATGLAKVAKDVKDMFQGALTSRIKCLVCENETCRSEGFLDLSVAVSFAFIFLFLFFFFFFFFF